MSSNIVNSAAKNSVFRTNGSAMTLANQPNNRTSVAFAYRSKLNGDGSVTSSNKRVPASRTIMIGATGVINGVARTTLIGGATTPNRAVNRRINLTVNRRLAKEGRFYNIRTGTYSEPKGTVAFAGSGLASDKAISVPGRVTFHIGARTPSSQNK